MKVSVKFKILKKLEDVITAGEVVRYVLLHTANIFPTKSQVFSFVKVSDETICGQIAS